MTTTRESAPEAAARSRAEPPADLLDGATHVRVETPDIDGNLRGKLMLAAKLRDGAQPMFPEAYLALAAADDELVEHGLGAPETGYGDMLIAPDWSTARRLPGREHVVAVVCDGLRKDGTPHPAHPRTVLRRVVDECAALGYASRVGVEFEFWVFRLDEPTRAALAGDGAQPTPLSRLAQGYSLLRWPDCGDFVDDLTATLGAYGVPIETVLTEIGDGMLEAALAPGDALQAADRAARFKLGAREVAARHGLLVSFIAKLRPQDQGSSGHVHQSLTADGVNVFWDGAPDRLSAVGRHYLAGLLLATHECGAMMAPFPNSYRRFDPAFWAPCEAAWGWDNRNACVRAITTSPGAARLEQRRPGADLQPYLTIAACLAGGLHGIRHELEPPAPAGAPGRADGALALDGDLATAARTLRSSELARAWLGDELVELYAAMRDAEARAWTRLHEAHVPPWEIKRYLEVV